jgi:hypothetical protein
MFLANESQESSEKGKSKGFLSLLRSSVLKRRRPGPSPVQLGLLPYTKSTANHSNTNGEHHQDWKRK